MDNLNNTLNQPVNAYTNPYSTNAQNIIPRRQNFSNEELNSVIIPDRMGKEIRSEKFRLFGIGFLSFLLTLTSSIFILFYYLKKNDPSFTVNDKYIPASWYMIILLIISALMLLLTLINYSHTLISVKKYKTDLLNNIETVPFFLKKNYKGLVTRYIYANWLCTTLYFIGAFAIGIFYLLNVSFNGNQVLDNKSLKIYVVITLVLMGFILICHFVALVSSKLRKGNIDAFYGYEIIPYEEVKELRKVANKRCLVSFLVFVGIILLAIVIPYIIIRRKRGQSIVPFK